MNPLETREFRQFLRVATIFLPDAQEAILVTCSRVPARPRDQKD
jgi:hypothetical protein